MDKHIINSYNQKLSDNASKLVRDFVLNESLEHYKDCSIAISDMCTENNHGCDDWAYEWADSLVTEVINLDAPLKEALDNVRNAFDEKIKEWKCNGVIAPDYDAEPAYTGVVYYAMNVISREINERLRLIRDHHYYESGFLRKTKIVALYHYDDVALNDFNRKYDRYEVAALMNYVSDKYELSNDELSGLYNKVKSIVYAHPEKKLKEIKIDVEREASSSKERCMFAFLFACAVMEKNA